MMNDDEKHSEYEIHGTPSGIQARIFFLPIFYPKTKIKICRALVLSLVLYGYETWSHT